MDSSNLSTGKRLLSSAGLIVFITVLSKIIGFVRDLAMTNYFGSGAYTDAYFVARKIPDTLFIAIAASISSVMIPMYTDRLTLKGAAVANRFANNIVNIGILISVIICIPGIVFSRYLVYFFAPKLSEQTALVATSLTRLMFVTLIFSVLLNIYAAILNSNKSFAGPQLAGLPLNICIIIACVFFSSRYGIYSLAIAYVIGSFFQVVIQLPFLKGKFKYKFILDFKDRSLYKMGFLLVPVLLGSSFDAINSLVDVNLASGLETGSISAINYSLRLMGFVTGIVVVAMSTVLFPHMSELTSLKQMRELKKFVRKSVLLLIILIMPLIVGVLFFSNDIIQLLFERGEFLPKDTALTSFAFKFYFIGVIFYGIRFVLGRVFYSLKDTKTPMINGAIAIIINIIFNFILIKPMRVGGLALATSISAFSACVLLFLSLYKKIGHLGLKSMIPTVLKVGFSLAVMSAVIVVLRLLPFPDYRIMLACCIVVGGIVYSALLNILKVPEFTWVFGTAKDMILKKLRINRG